MGGLAAGRNQRWGLWVETRRHSKGQVSSAPQAWPDNSESPRGTGEAGWAGSFEKNRRGDPQSLQTGRIGEPWRGQFPVSRPSPPTASIKVRSPLSSPPPGPPYLILHRYDRCYRTLIGHLAGSDPFPQDPHPWSGQHLDSRTSRVGRVLQVTGGWGRAESGAYV